MTPEISLPKEAKKIYSYDTVSYTHLVVMTRKNPIFATRSSEEERRVDALALRADERRDKLRKVTGRSKYPLIRECLNGETHMRIPHVSIRQSITYGGEPGALKHLSTRRKRKKTRFRK